MLTKSYYQLAAPTSGHYLRWVTLQTKHINLIGFCDLLMKGVWNGNLWSYGFNINIKFQFKKFLICFHLKFVSGLVRRERGPHILVKTICSLSDNMRFTSNSAPHFESFSLLSLPPPSLVRLLHRQSSWPDLEKKVSSLYSCLVTASTRMMWDACDDGLSWTVLCENEVCISPLSPFKIF